MTAKFSTGAFVVGLVLATLAWGQSAAGESPSPDKTEVKEQKHGPNPGKEIGSGAGTIGTGVAKGASSLGKGTAKGAADLVTLHPLNAGASIGKGTAAAGKDVTVGSAKGTGKIAKGLGRAFRKIF